MGLLLVVGCGQPDATNDVARDTDRSLPTDQADPIKPKPFTAKIKFKDGSGMTAFSIKPQEDGAKLVDADEQEIARFNLSGSKLKIKTPDDQVLGYVIALEGRYKVENAEQDVELWKLQRQDDGDWKLEDGKGLLSCKIKKRSYGFEIEDANEGSLYKVKLKDGKTSLRDPAERTVYYTKDEVPPIAVACLGLESLEDIPLKTALLTMLLFDVDR